MKIMKATISLLLILCLVLPMVPVQAAEEPQSVTVPTAEPPVSETADSVQPLRLGSDCQILRYVDEEVFRSRDHIARFKTEETLSSYVFLNRDGTKTVYFMDEPVKFQDAGGRIWEKDLTLTAASDGYTTACNDVALTLPEDPASGIRLSHGGKQITLIPQGGALSEAAAVTDSTVTYPDYFGDGISLCYTPTLSGVKEDIILDAYAGVNSFTFTLNTGGLNLYQAGGKWFLAEGKTSVSRIELGDIVAFDAHGRFSIGTMTSRTLMPGQSYRLTLTVDEAFLTDAATTYPVTIDPTLTATDGTVTATAIQDATVYSGQTDLNTHDWMYHHIGYYDATYGTGETVVRLSGLLSSDIYELADADWFTEAEFYVFDASGNSGQTVNLYPMVSNTAWTESGITWANKGSRRTAAVDSVTLAAGGQGAFDILSLLKDWKNGDENANAGFILVADDSNTAISTIYSSEHDNSDKRPYVVVSYQNDVWLNTDIAEMDAGAAVTLTAGTKIEGDTVTWTSADTSIATVTSTGDYTCRVTGVRSGNTTVTATLPNGQTATCEVYVTITDGTYFIRHSSGLYMGVDQGVVNGSPVELLSKKSSGPQQLRQVWKIQHIERNVYSIRSVYRLDMSLNVTNSTTVNTAPLDTDLTPQETPINREWKILRQGECYTFGYAGTQALTITAAEEAPTSGSDLKVISSDAPVWSLEWKSVSNQILLLNTVSGLPAQNVVREMELDNTATSASMNLLATFVSRSTNEQSFTWTSTDTSVATVNSETGAVTAVGRGTTKIRATNSRASNTVEFTVNVFETIYVKNFYDSTALYIKDKVPTAVEFLNKAYTKEFYLRFEMDGVNISLSTSGVDSCACGARQDCVSSSETNCSSDCRQHHKNVHRISDYLYSTFFEENHVIVMWSDCKEGVYCWAKDTEMADGSIYPVHTTYERELAVVAFEETTAGRVYDPVVQILTISQSSLVKDSSYLDEAYISLILAHEIAHTLGMSDVYDDSYYDDAPHTSANSAICIMRTLDIDDVNEIYELLSGKEGQPLCDDCISILHNEISDDVYMD